ncbi:GIY-YIG nuclease family protein [Rhodobacter sp. NTK016B]|uniref:GIY-YIG nuclease family protein n=1 Tax=Rhodobacter sp. NTK016B TaxID=2759676 RepID=UPI001A8DDCC2|nr:GIY-YIG nuclease family protein [Rhodobacter sp. NTK016B]MBN8294362.1 GIY-YIG nuclease family protein [Rhodobacter sp. NTK016B]
MSAQGRSLELFFIDGRPDGMLTAEVFNWTGHVLRAPRTQLKEALQRREAGYTGVYLLFGEEEGRARLYIGEAEDMRERLRSHAQNKDWWDYAVLISAAADVLHKAHVKYLESRLVEIARDVGGAELENGNQPTRSSLSEAATANMESFIETLMMVLPAIRVDAFLNKKRSVVTATAQEPDDRAPIFAFKVPRHGVSATAILRDGEMIVRAGSIGRLEWVAERRNNTSYARLHRELVEHGVIVPDGDNGRFTSDFAFSSPSAAAAVLAGRAAHGRTHWVHISTGKTYAEWEEMQLERADP